MTAETIRIAYGVLLLLTVIIATWIVAVTWRWRRVPGSTALMIQMIGEGWWTLCYALQLFSFFHPSSEPFFWSKMTFWGVVMIPAGFLVWTSRYTGNDRWVTPWTIALLCIEPVVFNLLVWTDSRHGLFSGTFLLNGRLGVAFYLHTLYSYLLLLAGAALLVLHWLRLPPSYKKQALLVLSGLVGSSLFNVMSVLVTGPLLRLDISPLGFMIAGVVFTYAQLRHRLFDIMPVARHAVVEGMRDGVVVLDNDNRIVDMNPAAQEMLHVRMDASLGKMAGAVLPFWANVEREAAGREETVIDYRLDDSAHRQIDLHLTQMRDKRNQPGGKLILLRDVTHLKNIERALRETNTALLLKIAEIEALQAKLKEQAIRDPLTGLYNRRFLEETLSRELAQAVRSQRPLSLAMIDLDHFKNINDTYGHEAGDRFLKALGDLLLELTRFGDVACRFGGEEFVVVLPGAPLEIAAIRVNSMRQAFASRKIEIAGASLGVTFSAGVAGFPLHGSDDAELLAEADRALYAAKAAGRDRVIAADKVYR
jgi:diguanylate cyclase (GGDEF)-like protein